MARTPDSELAAQLAKPSFTPGRAHAGALVELVVRGEEPTSDRAAAALAVLGEVGRKAIEGRLGVGATERRAMERDAAATARSVGDTAELDAAATARSVGDTAELDAAATGRLVAVLGRLARLGDAAARAQVIARVGDPEVRVRRAAIAAVGKLGAGDDARDVLLARWDAGDAPPDERRSLAEALGKVGGEAALARLKGITTEDGELARRRDRAILMADRSAKREDASDVVTDVAPPAPVTVRLSCRPGLGVLLGEELTAAGIAARADDRGATLVLDRPLATLFTARLWTTAAIDVPLPSGDDLAAAIVQAIVAPATRALLTAWTRGPIRWRLGFAHGHKRAIVWRVARDVTAAAPEMINDPSATTWDILVEERRLSFVPRRLADPRFAYRVADIPAASHPTVAAALAWAAGAEPTDRVWDPFCGSGLELIERARRGPFGALLGSDSDPAALAAARANLAAAGVAAELAEADARSHAPGPVDLVITNPPLGSRVQLDAASLLVAALPGFVRQLAPRGRLVWITPAPRRTTPAAEQLGLVRTRALAVDLGGVRGQLERWDRRP